MRLLRICATSVPLLLMSAATGADSTGREDSSGLGAAKEQLEALDAAKTRELLGGGNRLPSAPLPALDAAPSVPDATSVIPRSRKLQLEKQRQATAKSKNWLIEAMREEKASKDSKDDNTARDRSEEPSLTEEELLKPGALLEAEAGKENADRREQREAKAQLAAEVVNPLRGYMATWMNPRDFQLLQAGRTDATGSSGMVSALSKSAPDFDAGFLQEARGGGGNSSSSSLPALNAPASNPYLADAPTSLPSLVLSEQTESGAPIPLSDSSFQTPTPLAPLLDPQSPTDGPSATRVPLAETLRGSDDAKYFKQLKRF